MKLRKLCSIVALCTVGFIAAVSLTGCKEPEEEYVGYSAGLLGTSWIWVGQSVESTDCSNSSSHDTGSGSDNWDPSQYGTTEIVTITQEPQTKDCIGYYIDFHYKKEQHIPVVNIGYWKGTKSIPAYSYKAEKYTDNYTGNVSYTPLDKDEQEIKAGATFTIQSYDFVETGNVFGFVSDEAKEIARKTCLIDVSVTPMTYSKDGDNLKFLYNETDTACGAKLKNSSTKCQVQLHKKFYGNWKKVSHDSAMDGN